MPAKDTMSLHQRILTDISGRILSGEWAPGHRIPFEYELMNKYRCSRMTVSKVLTHLANAGMIERRRKAGTFVARPHAQSAVLEIADVKTEVAALGLPYSFKITTHRKRKSTAADRTTLDLAKAEKRPALVILNRMPARGKLADQMRMKYAELGSPVADTVLGSRVAFASSMLEGKGISEQGGAGAAGAEMRALAAEILRRLAPAQ